MNISVTKHLLAEDRGSLIHPVKRQINCVNVDIAVRQHIVRAEVVEQRRVGWEHAGLQLIPTTKKETTQVMEKETASARSPNSRGVKHLRCYYSEEARTLVTKDGLPMQCCLLCTDWDKRRKLPEEQA